MIILNSRGRNLKTNRREVIINNLNLNLWKKENSRQAGKRELESASSEDED